VALQSGLGLIVLAVLAYGLSEDRTAVPFRDHLKVVAAGLAVQLVLAVLLLKLPVSHAVFDWLTGLVHGLQAASESGTGFVFGYLGGGPLPFEETQPGASFVLAFRALPLILVVSALSALLFYWRVLPLVVSALSWLLQKSLGVGGAVGLGTAANVFVGMVEAPLLIRPFLARLSRGELFAVMTCGMATVAGTVLALYAAILGPVLPDALGHLLIASILSVPAAITVARLMVPDPAPPTPAALDAATCRAGASSAMDAVTRGTLDGVRLLINVIAMLIVLVALVHLCNQLLTLLPEVAGAELTLQRAFGWAFALLAWLMGLPPQLVLWLVFLMASLLTELVSNNAVAVVVTPLAISLALELGIDPRPFVVAVMIAASASFATPIGYQTNTLVYAPGGYRFTDYMRLGIPLNLGVGVLAALLIPLFWSF
jgi:CNT family concentrative nucleoside transporter